MNACDGGDEREQASRAARRTPQPKPAARGGTRRGAAKTLDRLLSRAGLCSRGAARALIAGGRVEVDGRIARDPGAFVDAERSKVQVDGRPLTRAEPLYVALNKPCGYLTSYGDPGARKTVYDLLGELEAWVGPVGRLDRDTSGLLLFTNDTALAERVANPGSKLAKVYRVRTARPIDDEALERLRAGVRLDDGPTLPAGVLCLRRYKGYALLELTICEGRNRQVRRMLSAVDNKVALLKRVRVGPVELGKLASGTWRRLSKAELGALGVDRRQ